VFGSALTSPSGIARHDALRAAAEVNDLVFEVATDPPLLTQFFEIHDKRFGSLHHVKAYRNDRSEDDDRRSSVLVARIGELCVGGARLTIKTPEQREPLPMEVGGFRLENAFPALLGPRMRYGQIGRLCLASEVASNAAMRALLWHLFGKVIELRLDKIVAAAPLSNARLYRQHCVGMGLMNVVIHNFVLPDCRAYGGVPHYLISGSVGKGKPEGVGE
jgi:hypothetical protein